MKKKLKRFLCGMMATGLTVAPLTTVYATNEDSSFPTTYTSQDGQYLFEKVSHRNSGTEEKDGIVDYTSPLQITENQQGLLKMLIVYNPIHIVQQLLVTGFTWELCMVH